MTSGFNHRFDVTSGVLAEESAALPQGLLRDLPEALVGAVETRA